MAFISVGAVASVVVAADFLDILEASTLMLEVGEEGSELKLTGLFKSTVASSILGLVTELWEL